MLETFVALSALLHQIEEPFVNPVAQAVLTVSVLKIQGCTLTVLQHFYKTDLVLLLKHSPWGSPCTWSCCARGPWARGHVVLLPGLLPGGPTAPQAVELYTCCASSSHGPGRYMQSRRAPPATAEARTANADRLALVAGETCKLPSIVSVRTLTNAWHYPHKL